MVTVTDTLKGITVEGSTQKECAKKLGVSESYLTVHKKDRFLVDGMKQITSKYKKHENELFSQRLRELIAARGYSHERFAKESGLARQTIEKIVSCVTVPRADTLVTICLTLDCSSDYILGLSDNERIY